MNLSANLNFIKGWYRELLTDLFAFTLRLRKAWKTPARREVRKKEKMKRKNMVVQFRKLLNCNLAIT
jgi:hypothetical protein